MHMEEGPTHRVDGRGKGSERRLELWVAGLSIAAGGIHAGAAPSHFAEWWGYGLFFVFATAFQVIFGLALLTNAVNEQHWGTGWQTARRRLYALGILLNAGIIILWAITRTIGIPLLGPEAGVVESVGVADTASKVFELALITLLVLLLRRPSGCP